MILVVAGPTATGKTDAAIEVARRFDVQLVSADAMQVYRGLDIGTAKPDAETLAAFPHHGIDIRDPHESYDAADFTVDTDAVIATGANVVVAGGSGFYLRALLVGLVATPESDPALRAELERIDDPHTLLQQVDPILAQRLHPNDRVRVIRGLEVHRQTGRRLSDLHAEHDKASPRHEAVRLVLDREDTKERIDQRVLQMMEAGYLDEVRGLLAAGVTSDLKPMRSLGYRWLAEHLEVDLPLDEAVRRTQRDTRTLARKQRTMIRSIGGFEAVAGGDVDAVLRAAERAFSREI
ncbi:MAG: tRNA (adenosine(37)-N6)-dimethylallyltransferase MiaA [Proteobacteria bacterium]|nr:tRNA (adenosine(37)-N6)-dimethylallyltransferase MiaA [Pseudomonadota bacterium]MCP4915744.1 tRNA (adenosine(37)-N6)-dimethylallyltransferase MiaA [Pseudomonadota bacterium]